MINLGGSESDDNEEIELLKLYRILTSLVDNFKLDNFTVKLFKVVAKNSINLTSIEEPTYKTMMMRKPNPTALKQRDETLSSILSTLKEIKKEKNQLIKSLKGEKASDNQISEQEDLMKKIETLKSKMDKRIKKDEFLNILCRIIYYIHHCSSQYVLSNQKTGSIHLTDNLFNELKSVLENTEINSQLKDDFYTLIENKNLVEKSQLEDSLPTTDESSMTNQDISPENIFVNLFKYSTETDINDTKELLLFYASSLNEDDSTKPSTDLSGVGRDAAKLASVQSGGGGFNKYSDSTFKYLHQKYWRWYHSIRVQAENDNALLRNLETAGRFILKFVLRIVGWIWTGILYVVVKWIYGFIMLIFKDILFNVVDSGVEAVTTVSTAKDQTNKLKKIGENIKTSDINNDGILAKIRNGQDIGENFIKNNIERLKDTQKFTKETIPQQVAAIVTTYLIFDAFGDVLNDFIGLLKQNADIISSKRRGYRIRNAPKVEDILKEIKGAKNQFVETKDLTLILVKIYNEIAKGNNNISKISLTSKKLKSNEEHKNHLGIMIFYSAFYYFQFHASIDENEIYDSKQINTQAIKDVNNWFEQTKRDLQKLVDENIFNIFISEYTRNLFQSKDNILFLNVKLKKEHKDILDECNLKYMNVSLGNNNISELVIKIADKSKIQTTAIQGSESTTAKGIGEQKFDAPVFIAHLCDFLNIISLSSQKINNQSLHFNKFEVTGMNNALITRESDTEQMRIMRSIYGT